jgi:hypothetical protein
MFLVFSYLQMSRPPTRSECYMDLGAKRSMEAPVDAVHQVQQHSVDTVANREKDTGSNAVVAVEELVAGDAVDEQCSRVEAAADDAEAEDPAARGGDDAA